MNTQVPPRRLLLLAVGFVLWAHALLAVYAVNAIGCAFAWPHALQRGSLVLLLAAHLAVLGWLAVRHWRRYRASQDAVRPIPFVEYVGLGAIVAAWVATLFTLAPSFVLSLCV